MALKVIWLSLLAATALYAAVDQKKYEVGKTLYYAKGCGNCHGTEAEGSSTFPRLANKEQNYLIEKLTAFKNGKTTTTQQEIMIGFAKALSKKEMDEITYFLSRFQKDHKREYEIEDDLLGVDF